VKRSVASLLLVVLTAAVAAQAWRCRRSSPPPHRPSRPAGPVTIRGFVRGADGPVKGAVVRVQATEHSVLSGADGAFELSAEAGKAVTVTAWREGHYIAWCHTTAGSGPVEIVLKPHYTEDNADYNWFSEEGAQGSKSCGHCMPRHYAEWKADAHSTSAINARFLSVYNGTDTRGNRSPRTRHRTDENHWIAPLKPDPNKPYYGPGYKLDFPNEPGNCAACHAPAAAAKLGFDLPGDVNNLTAREREGVFCEFCHKIGDVTLDASTGLPYWNTPGVNSMRLYRPEDGNQLFFGTFDDVTRRVTYSPLLTESRFCAPCHWGIFSGVLIYNSFGEWVDSPYSDPNVGKTCQDCHMPVTDDTWFVLPEKGGHHRKPGRIFNHRMPGAADVAFLQDTAKLVVHAERRDGRIVVDVEVTNEKAGHHIPTDHPSRNILLVLSVTDAAGNELEHLGRQVLPQWAGAGGDPDDYAGRPGKGYAKILEEVWTGTWPSIAYWRQTSLRADTRIEALATDRTHYEFRPPAKGGPVTVQARLIFRRAFKELAKQKKWNVKDILMEHEKAVVP